MLANLQVPMTYIVMIVEELSGADPEPPIGGGAELNNRARNFWPRPFYETTPT